MDTGLSPVNIGVVMNPNNVPTIQFLPGVHINTQAKSVMLSLPECTFEFENTAFWPCGILFNMPYRADLRVNKAMVYVVLFTA